MKTNILGMMLITLGILQMRKVADPFRVWKTQYRLNKYNPLTYVTILVFVVLVVAVYGFSGVKEHINIKKEFKWK